MARERNPRRVILERVTNIKRSAAWIFSRWETYGRTTEGVTLADGRMSHVWRNMRPEEYPENQARAYRDSLIVVESMINELTELRNYMVTTHNARYESGELR